MEEDAADAAARRRRLAQAREEAALKRRSQARRPPRRCSTPRPAASFACLCCAGAPALQRPAATGHVAPACAAARTARRSSVASW